jgi:hypothetical protein
MFNLGALSTNEIRELEERAPVEGGDVRYRPLNMGELGGTDAADPATTRLVRRCRPMPRPEATGPTYRFHGRNPPTAEARTPVVASADVDRCRRGRGTMRLYDPIDSWGGEWGVSAKEFAKALDTLPDDTSEIRLHINSPGGEVYEGRDPQPAPQPQGPRRRRRGWARRLRCVVHRLRAPTRWSWAATRS